jgi:GntR family transcriptional regulator
MMEASMVDRGDGRHTYESIAWDIRGRIGRGDLRPGDPIPSLPAIQRDLKVSNQTAQAAVRLLKSWGLVEGKSGLGTFVRELRPIVHVMTDMTVPGPAGKRRTWREIVSEYGMVGAQQVTGAGRTPAPADVAEALGIAAEAPVAWRQRLLLADGRPIMICSSYYPDAIADVVPALAEPARLPSNAMELMARVGHAIVPGGRDTVFGRAATAEEAAQLGAQAGAPVTETFRVAYDADGLVVLVERMVADGLRLRQVWRF